MSFASIGENRQARPTLETSEKSKYLFAELRNCLHIIEVQLPSQGVLSPDLKPVLYERVQTANKLIEKIRRLELGEGKKWRGDLEKEVGRLARLTNAVYRAEQAASDTSSEDGGEKEGFIASWESDCYDVQLHTDILEARDAKITHISTAIDQVNSLFKDISLMVNDQGEALDRIEDYIGTAAVNSKKAGEELSKAEKRTVANRCRQGWLALLAMLLLLLLALSTTVYWQRRKQMETLAQ